MQISKSSKKAYQKPVIKSEKVIETAALGCGKCIAGNPISQAACKVRPRMS
jgi:hypothetical protein